MLLDCFAIPCVMLLSKMFLGRVYTWQHLLGVLTCLCGLGITVASDIYDVHFATYIIEKPSAGSAHYPGWQFAESGTMETASVYYGAAKWFSVSGSGNNIQDATSIRIGIGIASSYQMLFGGYCYFYNLGDSTKFSYVTGQTSLAETGGTVFNTTYTGVLRQGTSSFVDQIRFKGDATLTSAKISLYGIRYA